MRKEREIKIGTRDDSERDSHADREIDRGIEGKPDNLDIRPSRQTLGNLRNILFDSRGLD